MLVLHQRRDFLESTVGHVRLTEWSEGWIERIAGVYRAQALRPRLERQTPAFDAAPLETTVERLSDAEAELAGLSEGARKAKPLPASRGAVRVDKSPWITTRPSAGSAERSSGAD